MAYEIAGKTFSTKETAESFYNLVAENIVRSAIEKCPVDTGRLRNSFKIGRFGSEPNEIYITNNCEYAVFVHELVFNRHDNGQAKFLEDSAWEVGHSYGVKTTMEVFPVTKSNPVAQGITVFLDYEAKGYDVEKRRKDMQVLFARYAQWRRETRLHNLQSNMKKFIMTGDIKYFNKINNIEKREAYENSVYDKLLKQFGEWSGQAGGQSGQVHDLEKLAVPLSKYFLPHSYSSDVLNSSKWIEIQSGLQPYADIKKDYLKKDKVDKSIDSQLSGFDVQTDYYNLDTHRFASKFMKDIPKQGVLRIKTYRDSTGGLGRAIERWEDTE